MNVLFLAWKCFGSIDIIDAFERIGHKVYSLELSEKAFREGYDEEFEEKCTAYAKKNSIALFFSFNYFASASSVAMKLGIPYFSWIYDNPCVKAYDKTITNNCNYIGVFDSYMEGELVSVGVNTVHYLPLAVNITRLDKSVCVNANQMRRPDIADDRPDIAMVGGLYNDKHSFYNRMLSSAKDMELAGYLDGIIAAQRLIYGYTFSDSCIDDRYLEIMKEAIPYDLSDNPYMNHRRIYSDYCLAPQMTYLDRVDLLRNMAKIGQTYFYTYDDSQVIRGAINRGKIDYYDDMPNLFHNAKINLNHTLRSIRNGIPLRAMDIMGCGGVLLTNYQEDFFRHFEDGVHFVSYSSIEEAVDKAAFILEHDDIRKQISEAAHTEMKNNHTYEKRLTEVFPLII